MSDFFPSDFGRGLTQRDFSAEPVGTRCAAFNLPLTPRDEWGDRIAEFDRERMWPSDVRADHNIESTNQGQSNFCWAHSTTTAVMLSRAMQGEAPVRLSATSMACRIKRFQNVGGNCTESLACAIEHGICTLSDWPEGPAGIRREFDTPDAWETAKRFAVTDWLDFEPGNIDQVVTAMLSGLVLAGDFDWWQHSVSLVRLRLSKSGIKSRTPVEVRILNSWRDSWGERGEKWLDAGQSIPKWGAVAPVVVRGS